MESLIIFALIAVGIIQIVMVIKFFEIAADIKDIRNIAVKSTSQESPKQDGSVQEKSIERKTISNESARITWQSWVAIGVIISGIILYLINCL